jgi:hypothetical protein
MGERQVGMTDRGMRNMRSPRSVQWGGLRDLRPDTELVDGYRVKRREWRVVRSGALNNEFRTLAG